MISLLLQPAAAHQAPRPRERPAAEPARTAEPLPGSGKLRVAVQPARESAIAAASSRRPRARRSQARKSSTTCTFSYVASLVLIGGVIASTRTGDRPARGAPKPSRRVVRRAAAAAAAVGARARPPFLASVE